MPQTKGEGSGTLKPDYERGGINVTVLSWILLGGVLAVVAFIWAKVNDPKQGVVSCCGCGECAHTGECVMVGKKAAGKGDSLS